MMPPSKRYTFEFAAAVTDHLRAIDKKFHSLIREKIEEQLRFEPAIETRNRKPLSEAAPLDATWEIRFGPGNRFRVLYDVNEETSTVEILGIGEKQGERLFIGGKDVKL
jgi:mRNA-degrading endonuclease RelE of RelBE toxin-antitoxin system